MGVNCLLCEPGNLTDAIFQLARLCIIIWMYGTWLFGGSYKIIKEKEPTARPWFHNCVEKRKEKTGAQHTSVEKK